jgi:hypothetical protein
MLCPNEFQSAAATDESVIAAGYLRRGTHRESISPEMSACGKQFQVAV